VKIDDNQLELNSQLTGSQNVRRFGKRQETCSKDTAELEKRKSQFNNTTRWLPDTAFTTYFGKPAFHPYGNGNTKPTIGGVNYGQNMLTHNINAECGDRAPMYQQVYETAMTKGLRKTKGLRVPALPRTKSSTEMAKTQVSDMKKRMPIMPKQNYQKGKPPKASILIAKAKMTIDGFQHSQSVKNLKESAAQKPPSKRSSMKQPTLKAKV
jgi:hypothetical protein